MNDQYDGPMCAVAIPKKILPALTGWFNERGIAVIMADDGEDDGVQFFTCVPSSSVIEPYVIADRWGMFLCWFGFVSMISMYVYAVCFTAARWTASAFLAMAVVIAVLTVEGHGRAKSRRNLYEALKRHQL